MTSVDPAPTPVPNAVSIVTRDMGATLAFYRLCGLTFPDDADDQPHADITVGGLRIMFDTRDVVRSFTPDWTTPSGGHRMALAFECASPAQVDALYARLVDAGHLSAHEPFDAFWGQRYAVVCDPDGNPVDFYCALD
ncbi:glyoxalase [Gordonia sp. HNM0687]|uniref:Glyoxalase n=1 Tax=Gordonia mangrovi TaxID=2665643 RepID=A0A6L7GLT8_9ACTN|nr:VOC family protein [Gordonia mangrovi]MDY6807552.1 VOC family protein [Actinomycetota bacterium]MXP20840.1 glyoxalase [Gordonia mangrovi]UVF78601.1 VOC family protein [Gordonia mangrovi]